MDSQIRYLAIVSEQPDTLARFYSTYFAMRELGRSDAGDVALTDGFYNISMLKPRDGAAELGISHLGITIDDIGQVEARLKDFAPKTDIRQEEGDLFHGDYSVTDPYGQVVSSFHSSVPHAEGRAHVSVHPPHRRMRSQQRRGARLLCQCLWFPRVDDEQRIRAKNRVVRWAADGETAMAILPDRERRDMNERESPRDGLNHFGWLVTDIEHFLNSLPEGCISQRPSSRPMAEYRGFDPDRNPFDISQDKGYEIDVDRWVHG